MRAQSRCEGSSTKSGAREREKKREKPELELQDESAEQA